IAVHLGHIRGSVECFFAATNCCCHLTAFNGLLPRCCTFASMHKVRKLIRKSHNQWKIFKRAPSKKLVGMPIHFLDCLPRDMCFVLSGANWQHKMKMNRDGALSGDEKCSSRETLAPC